MRKEVANPDAFVSGIAARHHGVVSLDQLRDAGLDGAAVTRRLRAGRLHRVHRGVYAVGHPKLSYEGRCMAAVLATRAAAVSHFSAAVLWGMLRREPGPIHVTVPNDNGRTRHRGIKIHRSRTLETSHATKRFGIAVTRPDRTLRDCHRVMDRTLYMRAVRRSLDLRLITADQLRTSDEATRSELERRFVALCRRNSLPVPLVNTRIGRYEVDFLWIDHRVIAETDGWSTHGRRVSFESDRARDAQLQAMGYRVVRFTYRQVFERPREVVEPLRGLLGL